MLSTRFAQTTYNYLKTNHDPDRAIQPSQFRTFAHRRAGLIMIRINGLSAFGGIPHGEAPFNLPPKPT